MKNNLYLCIPSLNTECSKEICYINGGECFKTLKKECSQEHLLENITNLQTIEQQYGFILSENAELENKITNLQEQLHKASLDIQELTERDLMCPTSCDKLTNLQEENERLRDQLENISLDEANIRADILLEQQDYKSRNEKAINILQGKSDE